MKKQLLLLAVVGGALAVSASSAFAATAEQTFTTPSSTGAVVADANVINVSGTIPEYIELTTIENALELGDIGGAQLVGQAVSFGGAKNAPGGAGTVPQTKNTTSGALEGDARIEFRANTFLTIGFTSANVSTPNPNGGTFTLPTSYRIAGKGRIEFKDSTGSLFGPANLPGNTATNSDGYASFSDPVSAANPNGLTLTYSPGTATNVPQTNPATPTGLRVMAEVTRNGLNDYRGTYTGTINVNYLKF